MKTLPNTSQTAARLRDKAEKALRLAAGLQPEDRARLTRFSEDLRLQAAELERQAAGETPSRPRDPGGKDTPAGPGLKKGRGGSNDPEPQQ
jgi:hypothetical protein